MDSIILQIFLLGENGYCADNFSLHYFLLLYGLYSYLNKHFNKVYKELESYSLQTLNVRNLDDYMKMRKYILEIKEYYQR